MTLHSNSLPSVGLILVHGTRGDGDSWKNPTDRFARELSWYAKSKLGFEYMLASIPFIWCGGVDGIIAGNNHWRGGAYGLSQYRRLHFGQIPVDIVAHSHGGQVVSLAASSNLVTNIRNVVLVSTPIRRDMAKHRERLRNRISGKLIYIHGGKTKDRWEWLGRIGGALDIFNGWSLPEADVNVKDDSHGHSDTLNLPFFAKHVLPRLEQTVET